MNELRQWTLELQPAYTAPAAVRAAIARRMPAAPDEFTTDVQLLASELVTNALIHGELRPDDRIYVKLSQRKDSIRVEVCDPGHGPGEPEPRGEPGLRGGFGLWLVEHVSSRWGIQRNRRTCVWFEMETA